MGELNYLPGNTPSMDASDPEASFMYSAFYDQPGMCAIVRTSDMKVRYVNRNFETAFGYLNKDIKVVGLKFTDMLEVEQILSFMQGVSLPADETAGSSPFGVFTLKGITGAAKRYTVFAAPIHHNAEAEYYHLLLLPEIRIENSSNKEVEEFAYIASHDLQEPLRKITTFSDKLTSKYKDELAGDGALYLSRMVAAANNMRLLIDGLLEFSRVGRTGQNFEPVALDNILNQVVADLETSIEETGVEIVYQPLPEIWAVASQMKQLFTNIITNAIKFRNKEVVPRVEIYSESVGDQELQMCGLDTSRRYTKIIFKDNGIGFEEEYASRIFQVFQRLHGKSEYPGSGIGLAICKKILDYHKGVIFATSKVGEGSSFAVLIPVHPMK
jgi:signal transduction histidine kinase